MLPEERSAPAHEEPGSLLFWRYSQCSILGDCIISFCGGFYFNYRKAEKRICFSGPAAFGGGGVAAQSKKTSFQRKKFLFVFSFKSKEHIKGFISL